jgi:hypothetical protein
LPVVKVGKYVRFRQADVLGYIEADGGTLRWPVDSRDRSRYREATESKASHPEGRQPHAIMLLKAHRERSAPKGANDLVFPNRLGAP